jgi:hypothetical protein
MGTQSQMLSEKMERLVETIVREFNDLEHFPSNRTRLRRLWERTHLPEEAFVDLVNEARARTKARGNISKPATGGIYPGLKNKAPYFFEVLESIIADVQDNAGPEVTERQASTAAVLGARAQQLPAFRATATITPEGTIQIAQQLDMEPGRYHVVLVIGNKVHGE